MNRRVWPGVVAGVVGVVVGCGARPQLDGTGVTGTPEAGAGPEAAAQVGGAAAEGVSESAP
jgi:hypothetical protein